MKPCPECGEPPHYHSWCTLCAQLFRVKPKPEPDEAAPRTCRIYMPRAVREQQIRAAFAAGLTKRQAAARMGCGEETVRAWLRQFDLPSLRRKRSMENA